MEVRSICHSLDRLDRATLAGDSEHEAGEHGLTVEQDCARSALSEFAAVLGSGEVEILAKNLEECLVGCEGDLGGLSVDD
jgi:hypothetical protein